MKHSTLLLCLCVTAAGSALAQQPQQQAQQALAAARATCQADIQNLCANVQPGGGRILDCMAQHKDELSAPCKQAIMKARQAAQSANQQNPGGQQTPSPQNPGRQTPSAPSPSAEPPPL